MGGKSEIKLMMVGVRMEIKRLEGGMSGCWCGTRKAVREDARWRPALRAVVPGQAVAGRSGAVPAAG